eukprot:568403-Amphidinium_carterae.1
MKSERSWTTPGGIEQEHTRQLPLSAAPDRHQSESHSTQVIAATYLKNAIDHCHRKHHVIYSCENLMTIRLKPVDLKFGTSVQKDDLGVTWFQSGGDRSLRGSCCEMNPACCHDVSAIYAKLLHQSCHMWMASCEPTLPCTICQPTQSLIGWTHRN